MRRGRPVKTLIKIFVALFALVIIGETASAQNYEFTLRQRRLFDQIAVELWAKANAADFSKIGYASLIVEYNSDYLTPAQNQNLTTTDSISSDINVSSPIVDINSNFNININQAFLDKNRIHDVLTNKYNILSYYKPDSKYQAINASLYFDKNLKIDKISNKSARKFTVTIFQNGKVMVSGCTDKTQILLVKNTIIKIFSENICTFLLKSQENSEKYELREDLSIWDII